MFKFVKKQMFVFLIVVVCIIPSLSMGQQSFPPELIPYAYADMVLYNGKVLTADEKFSIAEAVAVRDGKILALDDSDRILKLAGPNTTRIDLEGETLIPGFIDVHAGRFFLGGQGPSGPDYLPNYSQIRFEDLDDGLRKIKEAVEKADPGEWVFCPCAAYGSSLPVNRSDAGRDRTKQPVAGEPRQYHWISQQ